MLNVIGCGIENWSNQIGTLGIPYATANHTFDKLFITHKCNAALRNIGLKVVLAKFHIFVQYDGDEKYYTLSMYKCF